MTAFDDIDWDELMAHAPGALWVLPDMDTIPTEPEIPMPAEIEETAAVWDAQIESVFSLIGVPTGSSIIASACRAVWAQISAAIMAHRREYIAASGAHTELDYYGQETDMPIAPPRNEQWFRIWSPDYTRVLWDLRTADKIGDVLDAIKKFMADNGIDDAPMTVDYGDDWNSRWSGRISISTNGDHQIHNNLEYLRYLTHVPNPLLPVPPTRPVVAVISETKDRAARIADCLGIDTPWLFGDGMSDEFEGLRADRVLIDATSPIDGNFAHVTRVASLKTPGCSISFVTVRNDRG